MKQGTTKRMIIMLVIAGTVFSRARGLRFCRTAFHLPTRTHCWPP